MPCSDGNPKFRDCLFKLMPMQRYSAQEALWQEQRNHMDKGGVGGVGGGGVGGLGAGLGGGSAAASSVLEQLREGARYEAMQNQTEAERMCGGCIRYGQVIQLLHPKSDKFVTVHRRTPAEMDKTAMFVCLEAAGREASWFTIMPFFKLRSEGEKVLVSDKVVLVPTKFSGNYLHSSMYNNKLASTFEV